MAQLQLSFLAGRVWHNWQAFAALEGLPDLQPAAYVVPDPQNQQIGGAQTQPFTLYLKPGSYIVGFSGTSAQPEGFAAKLLDQGTRSPLFSNWVNFGTLSQPVPEYGIDYPMVLLAAPRLILVPGALNVTIRNLSPNPNTIEIVVYVAEPQ